MNMKRILGAAGIAAILATASPARADHAQELAAQALYDKALELMKAGKPASACPLLSESQRLDPAAGTQYRLAECFEKTGRTAEAWKLYTEAAEASKNAGRKDREAQARERAEIVRKLLPRLTITIPPELAKADQLAVTRDGKTVPREEWNREIPVEPGEHTVEAQATGKKAWRGTMTARAGATAEVRVPMLDAMAVVAGPVAAKSDGALSMETAAVQALRSGPNKMVVIAGAAAGAVALAMGVGFTAAASAKASQFASATASGCLSDMHDGQYWGCSKSVLAIDSSRVTFTNLAGSSFIAAGILGAGTLTYVLLSSSSRSKSPPAAAVVVLPGVAFGTATFPW
jgi:hypothetical protein